MRNTVVDMEYLHPRLRHPRTGERLAALAFGRRGPVWPVMGGSGEDDPDDDPETDPEVEPEDDPETDPETDPSDDVDPETEFLSGLTTEQAAYFTEYQAKLAKANGNARKHRLARAALEQKLGTAPVKKTGDQAPAFDPVAFRAELKAEFEREAKTGQLQRQAVDALKEAGVGAGLDAALAKQALARAAKMLDLSAIDDEEDLELEVANLKTVMPGLFGKPVRKKPAGGAAGPRKTTTRTSASDGISALFD